jgi:hypothetical protein
MRHEFVEEIPERLGEGVLYVSIPYATAVHTCFCGCGNEVVTPITPTDWELRFDGETVSLHPSIGSWSLDCRSHYWIRHDRVEWADDWSQDQVDHARSMDRRAKERWYGEKHGEVDAAIRVADPQQPRGYLRSLVGRLVGRFRRQR